MDLPPRTQLVSLYLISYEYARCVGLISFEYSKFLQIDKIFVGRATITVMRCRRCLHRKLSYQTLSSIVKAIQSKFPIGARARRKSDWRRARVYQHDLHARRGPVQFCIRNRDRTFQTRAARVWCLSVCSRQLLGVVKLFEKIQ